MVVSARRSRRDRAPRGPRQRLGTSTIEAPSSSASAQACSGPAPPNATSAKSLGSWPRSTETTRKARSISALTTSTTASGSMPPSARSAASASSSRPAGETRRQAAEQEVGIRHGRRRTAAAVAGRAGVRPGALRADAQRAACVPPDDRAAAGTDRVDVDHREPDRERRPPLFPRCALPCPPAMRQTSVEVPPMSNAIAFSQPAERGDPLGSHHPCGRAGDEDHRRVRRRPRRSSRRRPDDRITSGSGSPAAAAEPPSERRYRAATGAR